MAAVGEEGEGDAVEVGAEVSGEGIVNFVNIVNIVYIVYIVIVDSVLFLKNVF